MLLSLVLAAAPMVDLSPYAVKPLPDGAREYSYDLAGVKALGASPDAVATHGEDKVKAFLKGLPRTVKLRVEATPVDLAAGRGVEAGALAKSFAAVRNTEIASDNPLAKKPPSKLRAPFDPAELRSTYRESLRDLLEAKLAGQEIAAPEPEAEPAPVVDLMEALRASVAASSAKASKGKPAAAKTSAKKSTRKRAAAS